MPATTWSDSAVVGSLVRMTPEAGQADMAVVDHPDRPGAEAAASRPPFFLKRREPHGLAGPGATS